MKDADWTGLRTFTMIEGETYFGSVSRRTTRHSHGGIILSKENDRCNTTLFKTMMFHVP